MKNIIFSIVIPTCNRNENLKICLDKLYIIIQKFGINNCEVIVSDDGKLNQAELLLTKNFPWVIWVVGPKKGPASNRNNGAKCARGVWLLFLDDDIIPDENLLWAYSNAISLNLDSQAFEGAIFPDDSSLLNKDMAECPVNTTGGCFWSANICIKKIFFEQIGMFDENFKIAAQEDQDLFERVKGKSPVVFVADAIVIHPVRIGSLIKSIKSINSISKNYSVYLRKYAYDSLTTILVNQYKLHILVFLKNISSFYFKRALVEFIWLIYGIPLNIYYFKK
jgi:GT2 family glycosyltransferase